MSSDWLVFTPLPNLACNPTEAQQTRSQLDTDIHCLQHSAGLTHLILSREWVRLQSLFPTTRISSYPRLELSRATAERKKITHLFLKERNSAAQSSAALMQRLSSLRLRRPAVRKHCYCHPVATERNRFFNSWQGRDCWSFTFLISEKNECELKDFSLTLRCYKVRFFVVRRLLHCQICSMNRKHSELMWSHFNEVRSWSQRNWKHHLHLFTVIITLL